MQSSKSHIRDINALVEDMIASNKQCRIYQAHSKPYVPAEDLPPLEIDTMEFEGRDITPDIDEGFHDDETWNPEVDADANVDVELREEMSFRRASTASGIRKNGRLRFGRSADVECVGGRMKVRCRPRMRKRILKVCRTVE
jgi:hypothetical protein